MSPEVYYGLSTQDFNLPQEFVTHSKDQSAPVAVVGNGGSLETLTQEQIDNINNSRLFRCNWAFKDPGKIKKQYAMYFSQAYGGTNEKDLTSQVDDAVANNKLHIYRYVIHVLYNHNPMCSLISSDGIAVWPTSGIQMLLQAAFMIRPPRLYIAGIDMYTYKREKLHLTKDETMEYLKNYGKKFSDSPDNSTGIGFIKDNMTLVTPKTFTDIILNKKFTYHNYESDILLTFNAFAQCILNKTEVIIYQCPVLTKIYEETNKNLELILNYFKSGENILNDINKKKISYNMWRLIHKTKKLALPD